MNKRIIYLVFLLPCFLYASEDNKLLHFVVSGKIVNQEGKEFKLSKVSSTSQDSCWVYVKENAGESWLDIELLYEGLEVPNYLFSVSPQTSESSILAYFHVSGYEEVFLNIFPGRAYSSTHGKNVSTYFIDFGEIILKKRKNVPGKIVDSPDPPIGSGNIAVPSNPQAKILLYVLERESNKVLQNVKLEFLGGERDAILNTDHEGKTYIPMDSLRSDSLNDLLSFESFKKGYMRVFHHMKLAKENWVNTVSVDTIWLDPIVKLPPLISGRLLFANRPVPVQKAIILANYALKELYVDTTDILGRFSIPTDNILLDSLSYKHEISISIYVVFPDQTTYSFDISLPSNHNNINLLINDGGFVRGTVFAEDSSRRVANLSVIAKIINPGQLGNFETTTDENGDFQLGFHSSIKQINLSIIDKSNVHQDVHLNNISVKSNDLGAIFLREKCRNSNYPFQTFCNPKFPAYKPQTFRVTEISGLLVGVAGAIWISTDYNNKYESNFCKRPPSSFYTNECEKNSRNRNWRGIGVGILGALILTRRYWQPNLFGKKANRLILNIGSPVHTGLGTPWFAPAIQIHSTF